jgi:hypothetical protein
MRERRATCSDVEPGRLRHFAEQRHLVCRDTGDPGPGAQQMQRSDRRHQPRGQSEVLQNILDHGLGASLRVHRNALSPKTTRPAAAHQYIAGLDLF